MWHEDAFPQFISMLKLVANISLYHCSDTKTMKFCWFMPSWVLWRHVPLPYAPLYHPVCTHQRYCSPLVLLLNYSNIGDLAIKYSYFRLWPPAPQKRIFWNLKGLIFLCRYGKFHGYRSEKNGLSRTCSCTQLTAHHQLPQTSSDLVQRRAQDYSKQQNVSCSKL